MFLSLSIKPALADPDPEYVNKDHALNLKSDSYCMDGYGVIQDNSGCKKLSIVLNDDGKSYNSQCLEKTETNPLVDGIYVFLPTGLPGTAQVQGFDILCADGSFTLFRAPDPVPLKE
jgi:hypothetical protein